MNSVLLMRWKHRNDFFTTSKANADDADTAAATDFRQRKSPSLLHPHDERCLLNMEKAAFDVRTFVELGLRQ